MQTSYKNFLSIPITCFIAMQLLYCNNAGTSSSVFLKDPLSIKLQACGSAGVGLTTDNNAGVINPAAADTEHIGVMAGGGITTFQSQYAQLFAGIPVFSRGVLKAFCNFINDTGMKEYNAYGKKMGDFSDTAGYAGLGYSQKISDRLAIGGAVQYIFETDINSTFSPSLGATYLLSDIWDIGIAASNIGKFGGFPLPMRITIGNALQLGNFVILLDAGWYKDSGIYVAGGPEFSIAEVIYLRAGINTIMLKQNSLFSALTFGVGIKPSDVFRFDYVIIPKEFGMEHKISVSFSFSTEHAATNTGSQEGGGQYEW
ncbi:MAG: hypothetical protein WC976_07140 [Caldisericia bacterium]